MRNGVQNKNMLDAIRRRWYGNCGRFPNITQYTQLLKKQPSNIACVCYRLRISIVSEANIYLPGNLMLVSLVILLVNIPIAISPLL